MKRLVTLFAAFGAFLLGAMAAAASPTDPAIVEREALIIAADEALDAIRREIEAGAIDDVGALDSRIRRLVSESRGRLAPVDRAIAEIEHSLAQLGPAPGADDPPESEPLAARRQALTERLRVHQGQRTRILANIEEGSTALTALSARRLALLYQGMIQRERGLVEAPLWRAGAAGASEFAEKAGRYFRAWGESRDSRVLGPLALLLLGFAVSFVVIGPVHAWLRRTFTRKLESYEPTWGRRVAAAGVKMLARIAPGLVGGFVVIEISRATGLLGPQGGAVAQAIWLALLAFLLVEGFTTGLFAPTSPSWALAPVEARKGRQASRLLLAIVLIFGLKTIATAMGEAAGLAADFNRLVEATGALLVGVLLVLLCRPSLWRLEAPAAPAPPPENAEEAGAEEAAQKTGVLPLIRRLALILGAAIVAGALAGYVRFADFAASRFYLIALIAAVAWFARAALRESAFWLEKKLHARGAEAGKDEEREMMRFWVGSGVDLFLLLALAPFLLMLIGLDWRSVADMIWRAFLGVRVGGISISLADILIAIGVFFVILGVTRFSQGALQRGPFKHSRLDIGVQNSLTTLLGYIGLIIAVIAAITSLGVNLSNLAIIAGALSVGVGFGLQSVVNNFVSGLILLFERPIKVGDWIITASGEGTVKKISVRSTEIETFDRSSIIVPNSELISQSVTNWTHKNKMGRVVVPVGVSYDSDPEQVRDVLLKCAREHPLALRYPEPSVYWKDFGASSLDFEVRIFIRDIGTVIDAKNSLRFTIFKALKDAGIEIPYPQRDLHIRSTPSSRKSAEPAPPAPAEAPAAPDADIEMAKDD